MAISRHQGLSALPRGGGAKGFQKKNQNLQAQINNPRKTDSERKNRNKTKQYGIRTKGKPRTEETKRREKKRLNIAQQMFQN